MRGDLLDVVLAVAALLFAISGYRQGFVVGALSFAGFLGGGVLGATLAPNVAGLSFLSSLPRSVVGLVFAFALASIGQVLASVVGGAVRRRLKEGPARTADSIAGAGISVVSLLLVAWLIGLAVASSPYPTAASQVRRSAIIGAVNGVVPDAGRRVFRSFRDLVDSRGFPEVFNDLQPAGNPDVAAPDPALAGSAAVRTALPSVLKVTGDAPSCSKSREGSGFVFAPGRVMTNAHVLAGVTTARVQVGDQRLPATVVLYDPERDVAVLRVPGLDRPALSFAASPAKRDAGALVLGYPLDGPFRAVAARVVARQDATAPDIYNDRTVQREIYTIKGQVLRGNSGGPLLSPQGRVDGVIFAAAADDSSIGYALTADYVRSAARTGAAATTPVPTGKCDD